MITVHLNLIGSLSNDEDDAKEKMKLNFTNEICAYLRSLRFAKGSKIVLKLNMQRRRSIPNRNMKK